MRKLLLILTIVSFSVMVYAAGDGTPADTTLSNVSTVDGANFSPVTATNLTTVLTNFGGTWTGEVDATGAVADTPITNTTWLSNNGNAEDVFTLDVPWTNYTGTPGADWTWLFNNTTSGASTVTACTIAAGAQAELDFVVTPDTGAQNSSTGDFRLRAQSSDATATNYVGDNGTAYGGTIGDNPSSLADFGPGYIVLDVNTNTSGPEWEVTVAGPVIAISKEVESVSNTTSGVAGAYPGATITYKIAVTNSGSANATSVYIEDAAPVNTTYVAGSLKLSAAEDTTATYATAGAATDAGADDNAAASAPNVEFEPGGDNTCAVDSTGTGVIYSEANGNDAAACFFQVTID